MLSREPHPGQRQRLSRHHLGFLEHISIPEVASTRWELSPLMMSLYGIIVTNKIDNVSKSQHPRFIPRSKSYKKPNKYRTIGANQPGTSSAYIWVLTHTGEEEICEHDCEPLS